MDKNSPIPMYYQLAEELRKKINNNIWPPGHCIDSERVLSEEYNLSRMTVRQAIGELVQAGLLTREKGRGTFVCEPKIKQRDIMSFTEIMESSGVDFRTEVVAFERIEADEDMFSLLKSDELFRIQRLRIVKEIIIAEEVIYIPCSTLPELEKKDLSGSFYKYLESRELTVGSTEASIQAVLLDDFYRGLFRLKEVVPLLKVSSKNYTAEDKLLFTEEAVYRSDKYTLDINISRRKGSVI
jgi:GntR family transcriptional regulator